MSRPAIVNEIADFKAPSEAEISKLSAAEAEQKASEALDLVTKFFDAQDDVKEFTADKEVKQYIKTLNQSAEELAAHAREQAEFEGIGRSAKSRRESLNAPANGLPNGQGKADGDREEKTFGEMFIESPGYKAVMERFEKFGDGDAAGKFGSAGVEIKTLVTGDSATSAGAFTVPSRRPNVDLILRELSILDIITRGQSDSDLIEYIKQTGFTNAAAVLGEATATGDATAKSPESALAFSKETETAKEVSHYIPITRKALRNAPQMRTYIDQVLLYGIEEKLEEQVLAGDGVGDNFTGILTQGDLTSQPFDTDVVTTIRKQRTQAKTVGRVRPTSVVLHPNDWEAIDLLQDAENRYYYGGPQTLGTPRIWGLPVVESEVITEGVSLLGDFSHAFLLDRQHAEILVSDSNEDWFLKKILALLAIGHFIFYVDRPAAFVEGDLTAV